MFFFQRDRFSGKCYCSISRDVRQVSETTPVFLYNYFEIVPSECWPNKKRNYGIYFSSPS